jgi:hypothetical protein
MIETMDIYAKPGTKVYFLGQNGYESELNIALKTFEIGKELTVMFIERGSSISYVTFLEYPDRSFNTVMFSQQNPFKKKSVKRIDGYQASDGKIFKTEDEAIDHQQYLDTYHGIKKIIGETYAGGDAGAINAAAYALANRRKELLDILKDNV